MAEQLAQVILGIGANRPHILWAVNYRSHHSPDEWCSAVLFVLAWGTRRFYFNLLPAWAFLL